MAGAQGPGSIWPVHSWLSCTCSKLQEDVAFLLENCVRWVTTLSQRGGRRPVHSASIAPHAVCARPGLGAGGGDPCSHPHSHRNASLSCGTHICALCGGAFS